MNSLERLTTRGNSNTIFPSLHEKDIVIKLHPLFCKLCGLQYGFSVTGKSYYCNTHVTIGILLDKYLKE